MGIVLASLAALHFVLLDILRKILTRRQGAVEIVVGINLGGALILLLPIARSGMPGFDGVFILLAFLEGITFTVASILYVEAVRLSPLSLTIPYLAFTPVVSAGVAAILISEYPAPEGLLGIGFVVLGALALHIQGGLRWTQLLRAPFREPGSWRMLIVALIWGITTSIDKIAISHGSEALLGFAMMGFSSFFLIGFALWRRRRPMSSPIETRPPLQEPLLYLAALVAAIAVLCQFYAYRELLVSYVETVKRAGGLLSVLAGGLFLGESGLMRRLPAAALMVIGILLIALMG